MSIIFALIIEPIEKSIHLNIFDVEINEFRFFLY